MKKLYYYAWLGGFIILFISSFSFPFVSNIFGIPFFPGEDGRPVFDLFVMAIWAISFMFFLYHCWNEISTIFGLIGNFLYGLFIFIVIVLISSGIIWLALFIVMFILGFFFGKILIDVFSVETQEWIISIITIICGLFALILAPHDFWGEGPGGKFKRKLKAKFSHKYFQEKYNLSKR